MRVTFSKREVIRCNQVYWTGQMNSMIAIIITSAEKRSLGRGRERIGGIGRCCVRYSTGTSYAFTGDDQL